MIAALATTLLLSAGPAAPQDPRPREREARSEPSRPAPSDEDAAIIEHLELLQRMEMLRDLDMVDTGEARPEPEPEREPGSSAPGSR